MPLDGRASLPDGFQPERISIGPRGTAYVGSLADGDVYVFDVRTGEEITTLEGPGTPSVGLKIDNRGRLFIAGGPTGEARVVDAATGDLLQSYTLTNAPTFVNDVVVTRDAAWFTDSQRAQLYKLPIGPGGALPEPDAVIRRVPPGEGCGQSYVEAKLHHVPSQKVTMRAAPAVRAHGRGCSPSAALRIAEIAPAIPPFQGAP